MRLKPILLQLIQAGRGDGLFRASHPWGFPGDRRWRLPPPCLAPADNRTAPSGPLATSAWIQDRQYAQSQEIKNLMGSQFS